MPQRRNELRGFVRRLPLALAAAVIVWLLAKPFYNEAICWTAQGLARLLEYPRVALILVHGDGKELSPKQTVRIEFQAYHLRQRHRHLVQT